MPTKPKPKNPIAKVTCAGGFRQLAYQVAPDGRCVFCTVFQAGSTKDCRFPADAKQEEE